MSGHRPKERSASVLGEPLVCSLLLGLSSSSGVGTALPGRVVRAGSGGQPRQCRDTDDDEDRCGDRHRRRESGALHTEAHEERSESEAGGIGKVVEGERPAERGWIGSEPLLADEGCRGRQQEGRGDAQETHADAGLPQLTGQADDQHRDRGGRHTRTDEETRRGGRGVPADDGVGDDRGERGETEEQADDERPGPPEVDRKYRLDAGERSCTDGDGEADGERAGYAEDGERTGGVVGHAG